MDINIFKKLGFSDKATSIYLALLRLGPSSVRQVSKVVEVNRGTVHEVLKWLQEQGLVDYYEKNTKQFFVAESPDKLEQVVQLRAQELKDVGQTLKLVIPELKSIHDKGGERPVSRYYEHDEIHLILENVLTTCEQTGEMLYRTYSTAGMREHLYKGFESFSDARIARKISVKVIAIGEGGELRGLDERKWLKTKIKTPTYIIIYPGKTAYISLNAQSEPVGVVIENDGVYNTQKIIFDSLWEQL